MDVPHAIRWSLLTAGIGIGGCMHPGYQYLTPPGFSSTAHRIELRKHEQQRLSTQGITQVPAPPQHEIATEGKSIPEERSHWAQSWRWPSAFSWKQSTEGGDADASPAGERTENVATEPNAASGR